MSPVRLLISSIGLCLFAWPCSLQALSQEAMALFSQGNIFYGQEQFTEARDSYLEALEIEHSFGLHFNLANAYYQLGNPGQAILHYEKALLLSPQNPEAKANLNGLRDQLNLEVPASPPWKAWAFALPTNYWVWQAVGSGWTLILMILLMKLWKMAHWSIRFIFVLSLLSLLATGAALLIHHPEGYRGIVLQNQAPLRVAPSLNSPGNTTLSAGQSVYFEFAQDQFVHVHTLDRTSGYLLRTEAALIWDLPTFD